MKATRMLRKQSGFFTLAVGLSLLAIYGAIGTGVVAVHESNASDDERTAMQAKFESTANATNKLDSREAE
jgi:hypothetical protein